DQAVIAIENARLLDELRQRTGELGQSVGELRALGEVSQAVNSTLDLPTVLSTIVARAVQLSGTEAGAIYVFDEAQRELHLRATYGMDQKLIDTLARQRIGLDETTVAQALAQREPVQIADLKQQPSSALYEIILQAGFRAVLVAPLLRGEEIVGLLVVRRRTPGSFPQNTIDLIKTFAAQSAVARRPRKYCRPSATPHSICKRYSIRWPNPQPISARPTQLPSGGPTEACSGQPRPLHLRPSGGSSPSRTRSF